MFLADLNRRYRGVNSSLVKVGITDAPHNPMKLSRFRSLIWHLLVQLFFCTRTELARVHDVITTPFVTQIL